eukprot:5361213-Prorocentrum_lima.AAC.1
MELDEKEDMQSEISPILSPILRMLNYHAQPRTFSRRLLQWIGIQQHTWQTWWFRRMLNIGKCSQRK